MLDRPNSYIGKTVPRPNLERLTQGRGEYVSDMVLPRMAHVVYLRSPYAHAKILGIDATEAKKMPGVIAVVTGAELAKGHFTVGRRSLASEGAEIGPAARHRGRSCMLAGRGGGRHHRDQPCFGRGRRRTTFRLITKSWSR